jgi:hypothetical protein
MRGILASLLLLGLLPGCSGPPLPAPVPLPAGSPADLIAEIANQALEADARMDRADTLYVAEPEILAEGRRRTGVPRYAGVESGGQLVISSTRVDLTAGFAWVEVEYRWVAPDKNIFREGRATLILVAPQAGFHWRIVHAHSSLAR